MAEGAQNGITHVHESNPPTPHLETSTEEHERPFTSPPPTREAMSILHQRRQKCELKRLLKHTCPELKNVDNLVEEELADFLNIDPVTVTKYQSDVQSRCWMFENHETNSVDLHDQKLQVKKEFQEGDLKRTVCMFEQPTSNSHIEENKPQLNESEEVTSEQSIRVDVKATRRMFETQSVDILRDIQSPCPKKNEEKSGLHPKIVSEINRKEASDIHHKNDFIDPNEAFVGISKAKQIFETISYDKENIPPTNDSFNREEELLKANVRNRAQMFESTPLDKINLQTKEESETILENMQETLVSLCNFSIMHSGGTILEANESGHVKKARYHFIQGDVRPEVHEEEIVTGSIKSIMLQMLSGITFNPTVTFLKEDSQGNVEIQKVDVPIHQLPFTQDKECRTANVVQITEDLLGQEKSQRKGVLIQDSSTGMREITVYALFIHSEDSVRAMEFGKIEGRSIPLSLRKVTEFEKIDIQTEISSSASSLIVETCETSNVQTFEGCTEKNEADHLERQQEISSDADIKMEITPANVNNIKALFTSTDQDEKSTECLITTESNLEESNQFEGSSKKGGNQDQGAYEDGAVLQAELVDVVEDDELVNLQTAIKNLHQATIEAKALQESVEAKQASQTQEICDPGSLAEEFTQNGNINENGELSQIAKTEREDDNKEEVMRGSLQAALDSLGKSNFNVTKGDFKAAMIYRNSGKGCAGHKKIVVEQPIHQTKENKPSTSSPVPSAEKETLQTPGEGTQKVSLDIAPKTRKTPLGPKPALPPKPDHLKMKPNPVGTQTVPAKSSKPTTEQIKEPSTPKSNQDPNHEVQNADHNNHDPSDTSMSNPESSEDKKCKVPSNSSKPPTEQMKEPSTPKSNPDPSLDPQKADHNNHDSSDTSVSNPESSEDKKCKVPSNSSNPPTEQMKEPSTPKSNQDPNHDPQKADSSDTTMSNTESPEDKSLEDTPKSSLESIESSTGLNATLQNFGVKRSGSVPPAKPKRIKMAKENAKNIAVNSTLSETDTAQGIPSSTQDNSETCKVDSNNHEERSDDQQVSQVVRRKKKMRGETEDERRQRLSVHMDEIMKVNVPAVMEIFDKLKQQEELKNILSKVEEIEEDTNKVDVSSLRNIFESVPDWVVPQEQPEIVTLEDLEEPSEPEIKSSMEVAFGDLEKAGAEIIRLKDQTLARLMDIEEAIKKALYSVSTLKSDSDIVGLSGLFRESMVAVQGSPPSGNIRKISIGSSKSPKALNQIGRSQQSMAQKKPELFIPKAKPRSTSPGSPSFISIQSAARKPSELPSPLKEEPKEEPKPQCCCSVPSDRRQCSVTKSLSSSPANPQRQVSVLEVKTMPEAERVIGTKTIKENYERTDSFGNKFYSSKTSTVVTTQPETKTTSRKLIMSNPAMSEIVTYPRINTPFIREDQSPQ